MDFLQVDCVVLVSDEDQDEYHPMSFQTHNSPALTGEIKSPVDDLQKLPLNERKVIARRASRVLRPGQTVNLGIGLPECLASVAGEEGMLPYITLTTEAGSFGGLVSRRHVCVPASRLHPHSIPLCEAFIWERIWAEHERSCAHRNESTV